MGEGERYSQIVELHGHIIDSLIFPKVLDAILDSGNEFIIHRADIGRRKGETSFAQIEIMAPTPEALHQIISEVQQIGAVAVESANAALEPAPADGVFPEHFYATTNLPMAVRVDGEWIPVEYPEMDCGIVVTNGRALCVPMSDVRAGDMVVVGHDGIRVTPQERPRSPSPIFAFMSSAVSTEKPKSVLVADVAREMQAVHDRGGRILVVAGPALVHTGSGDLLCRLIEAGYVQLLFAGNALATHDVEAAFFGTSLGVSLAKGTLHEHGHQHHLRAINRIRAAGGLRQAVAKGILRRGIMYTCVTHGVAYVLAGSVRDDGPLPDVITDALEAQRRMRALVRQGVDMALMLSTMLHSVATGNLLPASVRTVCVDINPAVVTKLIDRGSFQTVGLVMDINSFLRELLEDLGLR
jgi:lysine-ketoglutarate reductase/saccharopine dehydrogenase-like protein (TIGR00300 family)